MGESTEDLEPLFDYSRVQPFDVVCLDDDCPDSSPVAIPKRRKTSHTAVEKELQNTGNVIHIVDCEDEDELDWLAPPPEMPIDPQKLCEDSTIKELRLQRQELVSFAQSAEDILRAVEETAKRDLTASLKSALESVVEMPSKPTVERAKIVISIQDKDGPKQFRVYLDDKFDRLFKLYADKVKQDVECLVFCFDGDKISPSATPGSLGMEEDDMIEVHRKSS